MRSDVTSQVKSMKVKKIKEIDEKTSVVTQFYQTKLCKHFQNGACLYGDKCSFSHSLEDLRERPNLTKTKMCASVEAGLNCPEGDKCPYAHAISELRATPMLYRTVLCSWWKKGQCEFGDNCRFAHGENQLRDVSPLPSPATALSLSNVSSAGHSLNNLSTAASSPSAVVAKPKPEPFPQMPHPILESTNNFAAPTAAYAAIFSAALSAATTAALQNGISVLTPQQTAAVAAAAAAAATEALKQRGKSPDGEPIVQPRTSSEPVVSPASLMKKELKKFKKGFSSSPALLSFFDAEDNQPLLTEWVPEEEHEAARPRADSEPGLKVTEKLMEEIRKLWHLETELSAPFSIAPNPLLVESAGRMMSASHATLDGYSVIMD